MDRAASRAHPLHTHTHRRREQERERECKREAATETNVRIGDWTERTIVKLQNLCSGRGRVGETERESEEKESQSSARACGLRSRFGRSVVLLGEGHSRLAQLLRCCCVLYFVYLCCCFISIRFPVTVVAIVVVVAILWTVLCR